jgi:hypothetical protein
MLIFRYISIAGTSHFLFEEGLDVIQKTFQAYLTDVPPIQSNNYPIILI